MWVEFGHVMAVSGLQGEVKVFLHNPESTWLRSWREVALVDRQGKRRCVRLKVRRGPGKRWLARVEGVDTREAAERLIGERVEVERSRLPKVEEAEYYISDVVGMVVRSGGAQVGVVTAVHTTGPVEIMEVEGSSGVRYVPSLKTHIERLDFDARVLHLRPDETEE